LATAALSVGLVAAPAAQAQPVITGGLVNVTVVDVIDGDVLSNNNVGVGVAAGIAANVCDAVDANAAVLGVVRDRSTDRTQCTSEAGDQQVTITQGGPPGQNR
jgi:hypothetical protein